jgi:O-antigen/teichoic acid export membrane protein
VKQQPPAVVVADGVAIVEPVRASLARGGGLVAPALTLVNVLGYALTLVAAHVLDKNAYGELGAYLGVLLVALVPALALQAVVARSVATRPAGEPTLPVVLRSAQLGVVFSVLAAAASPAVAAFLHTGVLGPLWLAAQLAPFVVLTAAMGVLQGSERFGALAVIIVAQGLGKAVGILPLLIGGGTSDVLAALFVGTTGTALLALVVLSPRHGAGALPLPTVRQVASATSGLLALLVIANLDVLLARNVLSGDESGRYSAGSVLAKAAFWLPQAVALVIFPRLADREAGKALLHKSVLVVGALGAVEVLGCVLLARPFLRITFGASYASLSDIAWLWVVQGAALSVVQLLIYRAIATHDQIVGRVVGAVAVAEAITVLVVAPSTPGPIIAIATVAALLLMAGLLLRSAR